MPRNRLTDGRQNEIGSGTQSVKKGAFRQISDFVTASFRFVSNVTNAVVNPQPPAPTKEQGKRKWRKNSLGDSLKNRKKSVCDTFLAMKQAQRMGKIQRNFVKNNPQHYRQQTRQSSRSGLDPNSTSPTPSRAGSRADLPTIECQRSFEVYGSRASGLELNGVNSDLTPRLSRSRTISEKPDQYSKMENFRRQESAPARTNSNENAPRSPRTPCSLTVPEPHKNKTQKRITR